MKSEIRIVIADDHPIVRQGLRQMLEADPQLTVIAEAGDGQTALELVETHQPEVIVLDIDMPHLDGFSVVRALQQRQLPVSIVLLTMHSEEALFQAAMDLGVAGYVLKDSAITDIVNSVKAVAAGQSYLSPTLSASLLQRRQRQTEHNASQPGLHSLTPMERRILKFIAEEKTSKEIAAELFISPRTVETHRTNISRKLELHGSLALVKFAIQHKDEL